MTSIDSSLCLKTQSLNYATFFPHLLQVLNIITIVWYHSQVVFTSSLNVERSNSDLNAHNTFMNSLALSPSSPDCKKFLKRKHDILMNSKYGKRKVLSMVWFSDEATKNDGH